MTARCSLCVALAAVALPAAAQSFVDLDFEQARVPVALPPVSALAWADAAPGWMHSEGDSTEFVYYLDGHLGYSQAFILFQDPLRTSPALSGSFAMGLRSGTFHEHEPRGDFVQATLSQRGVIPADAQSVRLLASSLHFELRLDGGAIAMRPADLDPSRPGDAQDLATYAGPWVGDVSSFAGRAVNLEIVNTFTGDVQGFSPDVLVVDDIRFLPIPEPATTTLMGAGMALMWVALRAARASPRA